MIEIPKGAENAKTAAEIFQAESMTQEEMRNEIEQRRLAGEPICSVAGETRYFLPETKAEILACKEDVYARHREIAQELNACNKIINSLPYGIGVRDMIEYEVKDVISIFGENKGYEKRLCLMTWNPGGEPKLDIRVWKPDGGDHRPGKGLTLTEGEATALCAALAQYLNRPKEEQ